MCSPDLGLSWTRKGQILTVGTKPSIPDWAGVGNFDVVWDWQSGRWFMVTSHMRGAVASHKGAAGVAWKKWDGREFTRENLQDESASFKDTSGKRLPNGENPSIHWNRFDGRFLFDQLKHSSTGFFSNGCWSGMGIMGISTSLLLKLFLILSLQRFL